MMRYLNGGLKQIVHDSFISLMEDCRSVLRKACNDFFHKDISFDNSGNGIYHPFINITLMKDGASYDG